MPIVTVWQPAISCWQLSSTQAFNPEFVGMNLLALVFFIVTAVLLWVVPRKYAPAPLLVGCCYMTIRQGVDVGEISLPIFRMLMAVGLLRAIMRGEWIAGSFNKIDKLMICLAGWLVFGSFFHSGRDGSGPIFILGLLFNLMLTYFLIRVWIQDLEGMENLAKIIAIMLIPLALAMAFEQMTSRNLFSAFGGLPEDVLVREGRVRAQGPFRHPILAGTVGAVSVPLMAGILKRYRCIASLGIVSGVVIVVASASSGPIMSLLTGACALGMWKLRHFTRLIIMIAAGVYCVLIIVMNRPPYYLISKIDILGGSTGWHRAFLIEQTFKYLPEWWLFGTDHTRHWMPNQGIGASENHTDITNYYIAFGVMGGLLAMILVIWILISAFRAVGLSRTSLDYKNRDQAFMIWAFGAGLLSHAVTGISVSYFDQSMIFFWLNVAAISSVYSITILNANNMESADFERGSVYENTERCVHTDTCGSQVLRNSEADS